MSKSTNEQVSKPLGPLAAILATIRPPDPDDEIVSDHPVDEPTVFNAKRPFGLSAKEGFCLLSVLQGTPNAAIAEQLAISEAKVAKLLRRSKLLAQSIERFLLVKVQRGEFGPIPMAKSASDHAMSALIHLMKMGRNESTRRQAAVDILALAGHVAVKRAEVLNVNSLIDEMAADELEKFIASGTWPDRFRDKAALLTMKNATNNKLIDITPRKV